MSKLYIEYVGETAKKPHKATDHAACYDVHACLPHSDYSLLPGERKMIPTGLKMCCDEGFRIAMYPRSGLSVKQGVTLVNCVGVIDADYRGEVMIPVINLSNEPVLISNGERIAQIALERLEPTELVLCLPETSSNRKGGFGSTGKE